MRWKMVSLAHRPSTADILNKGIAKSHKKNSYFPQKPVSFLKWVSHFGICDKLEIMVLRANGPDLQQTSVILCFLAPCGFNLSAQR